MSESSGPPKTYEGSCHCGLIKYTATLPEALAPEGKGKINRCNCSICTKNANDPSPTGYFLVYPKREDVHFHDGCEDKMKSYLMANKLRPHRFCPDCSSSILIDFKDADIEEQKPLLAMNAALFKDIDLEHAEFTTFDGRNRLGPKYEGYS